MIEVAFGKTYRVRTGATAAALMCVYLGCSFESLDDLSNGVRRDAPEADASRDGVARAEVAAVPAGTGGNGGSKGDTLGGAVGSSDADAVPAAGGAGGLASGAGGVGDSGSATGGAGGTGPGTDGVDGDVADGSVAESGGAAVDAGGLGGSAGETGSGGVSGAGGSGGQGAGGSESDASLPSYDAGVDVFESADSEPADVPVIRKTVLFVVASTPLGTVDTVIRSHLETRGYDVTPIRERDLDAVKTVDASLVLISRGTWAVAVGTKFRATSVPVLVCEPSIYVDMGMVDRTLGSWGTLSSTFLMMNPLAGSLGAGLSGLQIMVNATTDEMSYGVPGAQGILVATFLNKPNLWSVFAYEKGALMFGLNAPARRGSFFFSKTSPSSLTTEGWRLFDAMVDWLTL